MRLFLFISMVLIGLASCGSEPEGIDQIKETLKAKKTELATLEKEINELQAKVDEKEPPKPKGRQLVTTMSIERRDFNRYITIQGNIEPNEMAIATPEMPGRIKTRPVEEGDFVRKGQVIATIDMEQVDKQMAELENSLAFARDVFNRQKRLWDQKIGSEIQFLQAKNNVESLEKTMETVQFQQTKSTIYAPISGYIQTVNQNPGELASPGMPVVQIMDTKKVKIVAEVPERYIGKVKKGDLLNVRFPALDMEQKARVKLLGKMINPNNRSFKAELSLANPKGTFKPNLSTEVLISDFQEKDAIVLPLPLVQQEVGGKQYVMTVVEDPKEGKIAKKVFVKTGESYDNTIVITEGLMGDETIIATGARGLTNGELIKM